MDQITVLEIHDTPPVRGQHLWRRIGNFLLIVPQFYVYDLRFNFKAWGSTFNNLFYSFKHCQIGFAILMGQSIWGQNMQWTLLLAGLGSIPFFQFNSNSNSFTFNSNSNSNSFGMKNSNSNSNSFLSIPIPIPIPFYQFLFNSFLNPN